MGTYTRPTALGGTAPRNSKNLAIAQYNTQMLTGKHTPIATARTPPRPGAAHLAVATLAALALATSAAPAGNSIDDAGGHGTQPNSAGGHSTHVRGTTTIVIAAAAAAAAATMAMSMVENTKLTVELPPPAAP